MPDKIALTLVYRPIKKRPDIEAKYILYIFKEGSILVGRNTFLDKAIHAFVLSHKNPERITNAREKLIQRSWSEKPIEIENVCDSLNELVDLLDLQKTGVLKWFTNKSTWLFELDEQDYEFLKNINKLHDKHLYVETVKSRKYTRLWKTIVDMLRNGSSKQEALEEIQLYLLAKRITRK